MKYIPMSTAPFVVGALTANTISATTLGASGTSTLGTANITTANVGTTVASTSSAVLNNTGQTATYLGHDIGSDHNAGFVGFTYAGNGSLSNQLTLGFSVGGPSLENKLIVGRSLVSTTVDMTVNGVLTTTGTFTPSSITTTGTIQGSVLTSTGAVNSTGPILLVNPAMNPTNSVYLVLGKGTGNHNEGYLSFYYNGNDNNSNAMELGFITTGPQEPVIQFNRQNVTLPAGKPLYVNDTTASTSNSTGSIVTPGGIGSGGYIHGYGVVANPGGFSSNGSDFFGYSSGTFTPSLTSFGALASVGTNPTFTTAAASGAYVLIGKVAIVTYYIRFSYSGSSLASNWVFLTLPSNLKVSNNIDEAPTGITDGFNTNFFGLTQPYQSVIFPNGQNLNNGSYNLTADGLHMAFFNAQTPAQANLGGAGSDQVFSGSITYITA